MKSDTGCRLRSRKTDSTNVLFSWIVILETPSVHDLDPCVLDLSGYRAAYLSTSKPLTSIMQVERLFPEIVWITFMDVLVVHYSDPQTNLKS